ncbi:MAG: nitrilase-related carbon-nitrogen hydrolase [Verrucomicrobiota bacterium]
MNVAALQLDIVWENKTANYDKVRRLLTGIAPGTIVVLPEMFATGFTANLALAEDTGESVAAIAKEYRVQILAGLVRRSGGPRSVVADFPDRRDGARPSNEAVLFDSLGREVARYAKMHPFQFAGESVVPGTEPVVVDCGEFKLAPAVCYDLRFPEGFRASVKRGANLFAVLANWPTARLDHWLTLLKARAIENQSYVIGVNRCGTDPNHTYPGRSQIISPRGEVLADAGAGEGVVGAALDLAELRDYRQTFPVLADAGL